MDKKELQRKLRANYNRDTWKEVLLEMFPEADMFAQERVVTFTRKEQEDLATNIVQYGEVDLEDDKLIFVEVDLKKESVNIARNRVGLRRLVDSEVISGVKDGAIITYYQPETDEWRITFYSERYGWDEDGNTIKEETHPMRYTYVVGPEEPCKTAAGQLQKVVQAGQSNTLETVLKAFSVQKVSKEFFKEYKEQYDKFVGHLTGKIWTKSGVKDVGDRISQFHFFFKATNDHEKEARDFVKKLLGRIVFLYFVQKKQWLGAESTEYKDGKPDFIYDLFKQVPEGEKDQFYSQWLAKLFFDTLNRDDDHAFEMPDGSTVYIPFLNGGLFEKDETDHNTESLPLPGKLFSNPEDTESPNTRGFLDFLSAYNFTIHEDSPGDHTIAVDPEMLGHIFENLLEDNKDKGAYYTPKPIVHYMCQESLIEYLLTELTSEKAEVSEKEELRGHLEDLIKKQEAGELVGFTEPILKSLKEVKVCDPAIGSGAFPMGILQEIYQAVETLHHLSPDNVRAIWELPDDDWHPAEVKKQIIQNSIYGVDIEKGAVDIARLRFWLSLIVDEEVPTALPNLDYKIVVGDSLVSKLVLNGQKKVVEINWEMKESVGKAKEYVENLRQTLDDIVYKQKDFFEADNEAKKDLREEIKKLKIDALIYQLKYDREYYNQKTEVKGGMMPTAIDREHNLNREMQLKGYTKLIEELQKVKSYPDPEFQHFEWKLDFPEILNSQYSSETGFDILIANPPYLGEKGNTDSFKDVKQGFLKKYYKRKMDLFYFFYHLAIKIMRENGTGCIISTNYFLTADSARVLRDYLKEKVQLSKIINFNEYKLFESARGQHNLISLFNKTNDQVIYDCMVKNFNKKGFFSTSDLNNGLISDEYLKINSLDLFQGVKNYIRITVSDRENHVIINEILSKIKNKGRKLGSIFNVSQGVLSGADKVTNRHIKADAAKSSEKGNGVFVLTNKEVTDLELTEKEKEIVKPLFKNSDINKWVVSEEHKYNLIYATRDLDITEYPNIKNHFLRYEDVIRMRSKNRGEMQAALKLGKWWVIFAARNKSVFEGEKIVCPQRSPTNTFGYNEGEWYASADVYFITKNEETPKSLLSLLSFLNSKLAYLWLYHRGKRKGDYLELYYTPLTEIPVPIELFDDDFKSLSRNIHRLKKNGENTSALEQQIDTLVYKIYNLTWEEVQVVDPEVEFSEEEYEKFNISG